MEYIVREKSIITGEDTLKPLCEFKRFPAFIGCTEQSIENDVLADMDWMICEKSGMIQLKKLLPLDLVYSGYHSEALGRVWEDHHLQFCDFIEKYNPQNILEIGGSNGVLAKEYTKKRKINKWTIVEPNPAFEGNSEINIIKGYFDNNFKLVGIDAVIHSHVIEHFYDPNQILLHIANFLKTGDFHIFSLPNLDKYLKNKFSNSINFEHTYFITDYFIEYLLAKYGFQIIDKYYYGEHSIFYATQKINTPAAPEIKNHFYENKKLYLDMVEYYDAEVNRLNRLIDNYSGKIFLFGAHIFSQFLIYRSLQIEKIINILDNSIIKKNKRLYGTSLFVVSPDVLKNINRAAVILKAGQYQVEVKRQLLEINPDIDIWE